MKVVKIFVLIISLHISLPCLAQTGCIASGIPLQADGTLYMSYNSSTGYYDLYGAKTNNPYSTYCVSPRGRSCLIKGIGTYSGTEVNYGALPCPIDSDWAPMALCLCLIFTIKPYRNRINNCKNELLKKIDWRRLNELNKFS